MIISRTPFRISFFGGGTDYPAWFKENKGSVLVTTIDKYCYITCRYLPPFFDHISKVYLDNRRIFISIYTRFYEAYNYYEPANITFPGVSQPIYLIAIQLAFYLGIETKVMVDGYIMEPQMPRLTTDEGTPMVTKYIPFGQAGFDCLRAGGILHNTYRKSSIK